MAASRHGGGRPALFVAAASSPSEGPSASWHAGVRPTDALGARRYEEGDVAASRHGGGRPALFVAAASSPSEGPSEGPSASWHAGVHPTDALGARRYEEGDSRFVDSPDALCVCRRPCQ